MPDAQPNKPGSAPSRIKFTARLTLAAYDVISEIQRRHRAQTGRVLPLWKVLDAAVTAYAQQEGIDLGH